eukprot:scaffold124915_cov32-Phaeocystis_antarctica.AAC.1
MGVLVGASEGLTAARVPGRAAVRKREGASSRQRPALPLAERRVVWRLTRFARILPDLVFVLGLPRPLILVGELVLGLDLGPLGQQLHPPRASFASGKWTVKCGGIGDLWALERKPWPQRSPSSASKWRGRSSRAWRAATQAGGLLERWVAAWAAASEGYFCRAAAPWLGAGGHVIDVVGDTARLVRDLLRVGVSGQGKGKWVW